MSTPKFVKSMLESDWKSFLAMVGMCAVVGLGIYGIGKYSDSKKMVFKQPANLAQKIANEMVLHAKGEEGMERAEWDDETEGYKNIKVKRYEHKFTSGNDIYVLEVRVGEDGKNDMHIEHYMTNRNFDKLKTAEDFLIFELQYGKPGIYIEKHISDYKIDGELDIWQAFIREEGYGALKDFTREERDDKNSGVKQYLLHDGQALEDGKWVDNPEYKKGTQEDYELLLKKIDEKIGDTWNNKVNPYTAP